ncbi:MAG: hypothetical protein WDZ37_04500 [Solirubrobacterales bacterium]
MRKVMLAISGTALLLTVAGTGEAGSGPRLNGSFKVTATITGDDYSIPLPAKTTDTYKFKSTCASGACATVALDRASGTRHVKSTLQKTASGVYQGTEGPDPYTCVKPIGAAGQFTADHEIKVTKSKRGKATKISGETKVHITGCAETFENVKLKGKLKT